MALEHQIGPTHLRPATDLAERVLLPGDPLWRATAAPLVGVLTALATMWVLGRDQWDRRSRVLPRGPRP